MLAIHLHITKHMPYDRRCRCWNSSAFIALALIYIRTSCSFFGVCLWASNTQTSALYLKSLIRSTGVESYPIGTVSIYIDVTKWANTTTAISNAASIAAHRTEIFVQLEMKKKNTIDPANRLHDFSSWRKMDVKFDSHRIFRIFRDSRHSFRSQIFLWVGITVDVK